METERDFCCPAYSVTELGERDTLETSTSGVTVTLQVAVLAW